MKVKEIVNLIRQDDKAVSISGKLVIKTGKQDKLAADILELVNEFYGNSKMGEVSDALEYARALYLTRYLPSVDQVSAKIATELIKKMWELHPNIPHGEKAEGFDSARWWLIFLASLKRTG